MKRVKREFKILGGYTVRWDSDTGEQGALIREHTDIAKAGDYGADPIGNGQFRMVPSGDIVGHAERNKRLSTKHH